MSKIEQLSITDLFSDDPKVKYPCAKNLLSIARKNPEKIYRDLNFFIELLESENRILKWTAIDIIGALAREDSPKTIDGLIDGIVGLLCDGNMITANHTISALSDIALAKPKYRAKINDELLKVEHYSFETDECRNICIGKVILAIDRYFDRLEDKEATIKFVMRQTSNTRHATRKKAEKFLRKYHRQKSLTSVMLK